MGLNGTHPSVGTLGADYLLENGSLYRYTGAGWNWSWSRLKSVPSTLGNGSFTSQVPVLLVSGNLDPVTPPQWAEEARKSLPNSLHVVTPGGHTTENKCLDSLGSQLLRGGSVQGLDTKCVSELRNPPFVLPTGER